jgi:hypothetical protein
LTAEEPVKKKGEDTNATIQYQMIKHNPYKYSSDDVIFYCYVVKNNIEKDKEDKVRTLFFSKGQPCMRSSPLTKRYGWGVHYDKDGKIAIFGADSPEYEKFSKDKTLKVIKAMKSSK